MKTHRTAAIMFTVAGLLAFPGASIAANRSSSAPPGAVAGASRSTASRPAAIQPSAPRPAAVRAAAPRPARQVSVIGRRYQTRNNSPAANRPSYKGYYARVADRAGARRFYIPPKHEPKGKVRQWRENRKFLDRAINRGDRIRLSTRPRFASPGGGYAREIAYLRGRGYRVSKNNKWMVAPAKVKPAPSGKIKGTFNGASSGR
jgi:hypothetical protein